MRLVTRGDLDGLTSALLMTMKEPIDKIVRDTERDLFMAPDDAKAYGIIDEVYTTPDQSLISEARARGALGGEGPAETQDERDRDAARPQKG